jgi:hypothetical protein
VNLRNLRIGSRPVRRVARRVRRSPAVLPPLDHRPGCLGSTPSRVVQRTARTKPTGLRARRTQPRRARAGVDDAAMTRRTPWRLLALRALDQVGVRALSTHGCPMPRLLYLPPGTPRADREALKVDGLVRAARHESNSARRAGTGSTWNPPHGRDTGRRLTHLGP